MPVSSIDPTRFVIGPAFVRYRDVAATGAFTDVGVTLDDVVMRLPSTWAAFDNLSGVITTPQGLDVLTSLGAEIDFTLPELFGAKLGLALPGAVFTAEVHADASGSPGSSTTTAAVAAGATVVPFTATTNFAVGDYFRIEAAANASVEYRQIVGISSLNITVDAPLHFAHLTGVAVVETTGDARDVVTPPVTRRLGDTAYKEWSMIAESGKSGWTELRLPRAISRTTTAELTIADDALSGIRVTISARSNPAALTDPIFKLYGATI